MDVFKKYIRQNGKKIRRNHKEEQVDKDNIILRISWCCFQLYLEWGKDAAGNIYLILYVEHIIMVRVSFSLKYSS